MTSAPLLKLHYASPEDVAQDLDMVIQSCSSLSEWSWDGASAEQPTKWNSFVQGVTPVSEADVAGLAGKIQVTPEIALSFSLLSSQGSTEAAFNVSAPTTSPATVAKVKDGLMERSKQWAEEGIESLFFFDLLTVAQTFVADLPVQSHQSSTAPGNSGATTSTEEEAKESEPPPIELARAFFWSHHLKAPSKLKDFNNWCPELRIWGIVRVGWPGYLCFEGEASAVDEMVRRVKGLQWHAIQLRIHNKWDWKPPNGKAAMDDALLSCALTKGHPDNTHRGEEGGKVRTGCQVIEDLGELVARLKECGLEKAEISEALGIRISGDTA
ncbi:hypothetical protein NDA18_002289 [Ustilago nuda]|nr:hypothetical protein NDA18_002289 [Ustilago nuda]